MKRFAAVTMASAIAGLVFSASLASAADSPSKRVEQGWEVNVTPINGMFAWGVHGKLKGPRTDAVSIRMTPIEFWENIHNILDALSLIAIPTVEIRNGKFGAKVDLLSMSFQADRPLSGLFFAGASTTFETTTAAFTGSYRFYQSERALLDIVAGARLWNANFSLNLAGGALLPGFGRTTKDTWWDPIIGISGRYNLTENVYVGGYGNVGGLASSDITWDLFGKVGYQAHEALDLFAGFRYLGVNYSNNGAIFDLGLYSPVAGVTLKF